MDEATIEGLAFVIRPSREVDKADLRVCLSWGQALSQGFVNDAGVRPYPKVLSSGKGRDKAFPDDKA